MKKILIYTALSLTTVSGITGCKKGFDQINSNPNATTNPTSYSIFNAATKAIMDDTRGAFSSARMCLPWVQYSAQTNYTEEDRFQYRDNVNTNLFRDYYTVGQNFKQIIDMNTDPLSKDLMSQYGNNNNQIAASRVMLAYIFSQLVDTYGDVPYYSYGNSDPDFQAFKINSDVLETKYASQLKIYTDLLKELKEVDEMVVDGAPVFTKGNQLFQTTEKLKKFANSLRLRIANRVKGVVPGAEQAIQEAITSGVMTSNDDNVGITYQNDLVLPSPMYSAFFINARNDFTISRTLVSALKGQKGPFGVDPRLQKFAAPKSAKLTDVQNKTYVESDNLNDYEGMPYGVVNALTQSQVKNSAISLLSSNVLRADYTEYFMEYAEVCFLLSENKGWDDAEYKKGIKASMEKWGISAAKINTYIASVPAANMVNVLTQKYYALFMQPYEAWAEWRRTGYPNFILKPGETAELVQPDNNSNTTYTFVPLGGFTEMPSRITYPIQQATLNKANYEAASKAIGGDKATTKLIWDKN